MGRALINILMKLGCMKIDKINDNNYNYPAFPIFVLFLDEAPIVSARMMSLFQTPPTVHFALLDGTPNDIKGAWSKVCGNKFQWAPSDNTIPQVILSLSNTCTYYTTILCPILIIESVDSISRDGPDMPYM